MKQKTRIMVVFAVLSSFLVLCGIAEANGPIAHWKLDEGGGIVAYDSVNGNNGAINGDPNWTAGQIGGALSFDGDGDYVRTTYQGGPSEYTISLWYNLNEDINTSTFTDRRALVSKTGDETPLVNFWSVMFVRADGYGGSGLRFQNEKSQSNYAIVDYQPAMFYKDEWHHVVVTGTTTEGKIYFDGELKNTTADNFVIGVWDDSVAFDIAGPPNGVVDRFFNGKVDDVMIYDRALSADEIQQLYVITTGIANIKETVAEKEEMLAVIDEQLDKEQSVYDELEGLLDAKDYFYTSKGDIVKAKQKIHSATQHQEQATDALEKSIEKLDDALETLGWEPEPEPEPDPNLISHWKLDELNGTVAYDLVGGNDGTVYGATWTAGQIDGALSFDGVNDYVNLGTDSSLDLGSGDCTLSAWFKSDVINARYAKIIQHYRYNELAIGLQLDDSSHAMFHLRDAGFNAADVIGSINIEDGDWHHIVGVRTATMIELFVDGVSDGTADASAVGDVVSNTDPWSIGAAYKYNTNQWINFVNGKIDDVRIHDRALSAPEVQLLYEGGL